MTARFLIPSCLFVVIGASLSSAQGAAPPALQGNTSVVIDGPPAPVAPEVVARDERGRVTVLAVRVAVLNVYGQLDEAVYQTTKAISDLVQVVPDRNQAALANSDSISVSAEHRFEALALPFRPVAGLTIPAR
jgi:hypothetical protein